MNFTSKSLSALFALGVSLVGFSAEQQIADTPPSGKWRPATSAAKSWPRFDSAMLDITGPYRQTGEMGPPGRGTGSNFFGLSVAVSNSRAIVGDDDDRAYILERDQASGRWQQVAQLDGDEYSYFGSAVAMSSDVVAIGAPGGNEVSIFVYKPATNTWTEEAILSGSDYSLGASFGQSVAMADTTAGKLLVVGAPEENAAAVFVRTGGSWNHETTLTPPDAMPPPPSYFAFGFVTATDGERIVVGWPSDTHSGFSEPGSAYVFERSASTWIFEQKLTAESFDDDFSLFGGGLAIADDLIVVGQPWYGRFQGAVHTYTLDSATDTWVRRSTLQATNGGTGDQMFGFVALAGDQLMVGASGHDVGAADSNEGAVFVYTAAGTGNWSLEQTLLGRADDRLHLAAMSGNTMLVGAPTADHLDFADRGHVRLFRDDAGRWAESQRPIFAMIDANEQFGYSVALSGDTAVVAAAEQVDPASYEFGVANVYVRGDHPGEWVWQAVLPSEHLDWIDERTFEGVAIDRDTIVLGVPARYDWSSHARMPGEAYIYRRTGTSWALQYTLSDPAGTIDDRLGWSVAVDGDTAVIGAIGLNGDRGGVYVLKRSAAGWSLAQTLAVAGTAGDHFGWSTAVSGDTIVVGAPHRDGNKGTVYVFGRSGSTWNLLTSLTASDTAVDDHFGHSVAMDGEMLIVGAPQKNLGSTKAAGKVYVFERSGSTWNERNILRSPVPIESGGFGTDVSIDGQSLVIGEPASDAAHMFKLRGATWTLVGSAYDVEESRFGASVSISGGSVLVGAYLAGAHDGGRAYVLDEDYDTIFAHDFEVE